MNVWVSDHATERFLERVRPGLGRHAAKLELARLCREFGRLVERPAWLSDRSPDPDFWLEVCEGIVVPCAVGPRWPVALTVLVRGEVSGEARARRAARRRARPSARAVTLASRGGDRWGGPSEDEWAA